MQEQARISAKNVKKNINEENYTERSSARACEVEKREREKSRTAIYRTRARAHLICRISFFFADILLHTVFKESGSEKRANINEEATKKLRVESTEQKGARKNAITTAILF